MRGVGEERDPDDAGGRGGGAPSGSQRAEAAGERPSAKEFVTGRDPLMGVPTRYPRPLGGVPRNRSRARSRLPRADLGRAAPVRLSPQQWWHWGKADHLRQQR